MNRLVVLGILANCIEPFSLLEGLGWLRHARRLTCKKAIPLRAIENGDHWWSDHGVRTSIVDRGYRPRLRGYQSNFVIVDQDAANLTARAHYEFELLLHGAHLLLAPSRIDLGDRAFLRWVLLEDD